MKMLWFKKRVFMSWNDYKEKIDFMDNFFWQQSVRRVNVRNGQ